MDFITLTELEIGASAEEIRQIADRDRDGSPDPEVIAQAINEAESLVKSRLVARGITLPLPEVSGQVKSIAAALARYNLYPFQAPEAVKERRLHAMHELDAFNQGKTTLGLDATVPGSVPIDVEAPERIFTLETLRDF